MMTNRNGFTLIELLVGLAMASVVMTAIFLSYQAQVRSKIGQDVLLDMQQASRAAMERMSSDFRMAGCDPFAVAGARIITANPTEIRFTMDISGGGAGNKSNGAIDAPGEDIRYALNAAGDLVRERFLLNASINGEQPIIENVDALDFVYLDENGIETANLNNIRSIEVSFVVRAGEAPREMMASFLDTRTYVNQRNEIILAPQNDYFRRLRLTTTVQCRNMGR
jgi:type IV pilus assembly protein PilW